MGFDWKSYLDFAVWLNNQTDTTFPESIKKRNVISRAYYSSLHETNEFYYDIFNKYPKRSSEKGNTHEDLINRFKVDIEQYFDRDDSLSEQLGEIKGLLNDFRVLRNEADYNGSPETEMDEFTVKQAFKSCEDISMTIKNIRNIYGV